MPERVLPCVLVLLLCAGWSRADTPGALVEKWLEAQSRVETWTADVTQTRTLRALAQPLKSEGRVWYAAPDRFRWELGDPPQTIAVRRRDELFVIYPRLKRAERYPLGGDQTAQWRDALTLLEAGFPQGRDELDARFDILSTAIREGVCEMRLRPKSPGARRMISEIQVAFSVEDLNLRSTELHFADGSTMRNDFANQETNQPLDPELFEPRLGPDLKISEPQR